MNHYERLGVHPSATPEQVRHAFRTAAREAHPDRNGDASSDRMVEINEAWHVLGDPLRRRAYDRLLALTSSVFDAGEATTAAQWPPPASPVEAVTIAPVKRRSNWRLLLSIETAVVGALVVISLINTSESSVPDGVLQTGDCVVLNANLPTEVSCTAKHSAVVERLVPFGSVCPSATVPYRNRSGRICVVPLPAAPSAPTASPSTANG